MGLIQKLFGTHSEREIKLIRPIMDKIVAMRPEMMKLSDGELKAKTKGFVVKWKKQSVQTSGYQIQYAQNNKMKSAKTVKIGNSKTKTKTISKLKARKKYFVRIRTFKTVKGVKYYSSWSAVKKITTK